MKRVILLAFAIATLCSATINGGTAGVVTVNCTGSNVPCSDPQGSFFFTSALIMDCSTFDQLPVGSRLMSATIQVPASEYLNRRSDVTVSVNGTPVDTLGVSNPDGQCNRSAWVTYVYANSFPQGIPGYVAGGTNTLRLSGTNMFSFWLFAVTMDVTYEMPPVFDITDQTPEIQRRVLISKLGSGDSYRSPYQTRDGQIGVGVTFRNDNGSPVPAGTDVYFRVVDPAGTARYLPENAKFPGDNHPDGASVNPDHGVTDSSGHVATTLTITSQYAGNNYRVEASTDPTMLTDPNFVCSAGCSASGILTAWKRVYLERHRMFRHGAFVVGTAAASQNLVKVSGLDSFAIGQSVRLVHAPPLDGSGTRSFYYVDRIINDIQRDPNNRTNRILVLGSTLAHTYSEDKSISTATIAHDGVGIPALGYFERDEGVLAPVFADAFVELSTITTAVTDIPFVNGVGNNQDLADKWFENTIVSGRYRPGNPNVKHVLGGSRESSGDNIGSTGTTGVLTPSPNYCWTWIGRIETDVGTHNNPLYGLNSITINRENVVHEFAHAWGVDKVFYSGSEGHCADNMALNPTLFCTMNSNLAEGAVTAANAAQLNDGIVGFHWLASDSEYTTIREQTDPVPLP